LGKAVVSGVDGITVFDALVMAGSRFQVLAGPASTRFHDPIEPMDTNMRLHAL
jgi:hypothetical protein